MMRCELLEDGSVRVYSELDMAPGDLLRIVARAIGGENAEIDFERGVAPPDPGKRKGSLRLGGLEDLREIERVIGVRKSRRRQRFARLAREREDLMEAAGRLDAAHSVLAAAVLNLSATLAEVLNP